MPNIGFINKCIINSEIRWGGYSVLVNYQSLLSNIFPLAPQLFFFIKYKWNRLLRVSFIELRNFVIYQHVNKKTAMVSLATSHIAHKFNQLNHVTLPISMLRLKNIIFY